MRLGLVPLLCFYHILTSTVIYLTNRFHVAVFSNRSQMTSKCGKNKEVAHEPQASVSKSVSLSQTLFFL